MTGSRWAFTPWAFAVTAITLGAACVIALVLFALLALVGAVYLVTVGWWLLPDRAGARPRGWRAGRRGAAAQREAGRRGRDGG